MGLGSGIRKKPIRIPDPGVKKTGSRIRIRNTEGDSLVWVGPEPSFLLDGGPDPADFILKLRQVNIIDN